MLAPVCRNFLKEAEEIGCSRRMNTLTLNRHTEILEILEIPQLMDTCVRNSYYEEALELAAYVRRLERKYSSIPVIQVACAHSSADALTPLVCAPDWAFRQNPWPVSPQFLPVSASFSQAVWNLKHSLIPRCVFPVCQALS